MKVSNSNQTVAPQSRKGAKMKGKKTMSKNQVTETANDTTKKLESSIKGYNLETLDLEDVPVKAEIEPAKDVPSAMERLGKDEDFILSVLNSALEAKAISEAREKAFGSKYVPKQSVLKYINSYRNSPQYAKMVTKERGDSGWKEQYAEQTKAILRDVKDVPFIMNAIRAEKITEEDNE